VTDPGGLDPSDCIKRPFFPEKAAFAMTKACFRKGSSFCRTSCGTRMNMKRILSLLIRVSLLAGGLEVARAGVD
jgi:hypothetical protein